VPTLDSGAREESASVRGVLVRVEELRFAGLVEAVVADGAKELSFADNFLHEAGMDSYAGLRRLRGGSQRGWVSYWAFLGSRLSARVPNGGGSEYCRAAAVATASVPKTLALAFRKCKSTRPERSRARAWNSHADQALLQGRQAPTGWFVRSPVLT
jgi:hypothetical protein